MALLTVVFTMLCLSVQRVLGHSPFEMPVITPIDLVGKVSANTAVLLAPLCYFNHVNCTSDACVIYLVPAVGSGVLNYDRDKNSSRANILTSSPYPTAFSNQDSKNYSLTEVGPLENFTCRNISERKNFRVGSDGNCSDTNCNGILPTGSNVRFKYIVIGLTSATNVTKVAILQETDWSNPIKLVSPKDFGAIDDGLAGRSPSMIAITTILSIILCLLLALLIVALVYGSRHEPEPMPVLGSLGVRQYNSHHLTPPVPQVNPSFEGDIKKYTTSEVLSDVGSANSDLQNCVQLRRYNGIRFSEESQIT